MSDPDIYTCPTCGVICDVCGCPPEPPPERAILLDLIAELQDASTGYDPDCQSGCGDVPGAGCPAHYEQAVERAADRAEARLREIGGDDADV